MPSKRVLLIGAVVALAAGGAVGGALAASGTFDPAAERQAFLNDAAGRLKVSPKELSDALQGAFFDRLDAAVAAGRLTKAQADEIKQRSKESGGLPFLGGPKPFFGHRFGGPLMGAIDAAAKYLGLTDAELASQLQSGKSLAQVANDRNKPVDGLNTSCRTRPAES